MKPLASWAIDSEPTQALGIIAKYFQHHYKLKDPEHSTIQWTIKLCSKVQQTVLPYKRLMRMCPWIGSHFHNWVPLTIMGSHIFGFLG